MEYRDWSSDVCSSDLFFFFFFFIIFFQPGTTDVKSDTFLQLHINSKILEIIIYKICNQTNLPQHSFCTQKPTLQKNINTFLSDINNTSKQNISLHIQSVGKIYIQIYHTYMKFLEIL
eukprot:TRINITY_DN17925_c0_g1_i1.p1 TRINITY_DN17925_c0_g1~~TRINITY_DN17925_c0_g1_i1.p1  ORF type:complete len:118 (+),score=1.92 TRINITY_DN17925_c0_g1_i1:2-355(+)